MLAAAPPPPISPGASAGGIDRIGSPLCWLMSSPLNQPTSSSPKRRSRGGGSVSGGAMSPTTSLKGSRRPSSTPFGRPSAMQSSSSAPTLPGTLPSLAPQSAGGQRSLPMGQQQQPPHRGLRGSGGGLACDGGGGGGAESPILIKIRRDASDSEGVSYKKRAPRTALASRNAALGDPLVEKVLPRLRAKGGAARTWSGAPGSPGSPPSGSVEDHPRAAWAAAVQGGGVGAHHRAASASAAYSAGAAPGSPPGHLASGGRGGHHHHHHHGRRKGSGGPGAAVVAAPVVVDPLDVAAAEESAALHSISSIAADIAKDLDGLIRGCDSIGEPPVANVDLLQEISTVSHRIRDDLAVPAPDSSAEVAESYDDPTLTRARKLAALTTKLCSELTASTESIGAGHSEDQEEVDALREISEGAKQVAEHMASLQGEKWAASVLSPTGGGSGPPGSAGARGGAGAGDKEGGGSQKQGGGGGGVHFAPGIVGGGEGLEGEIEDDGELQDEPIGELPKEKTTATPKIMRRCSTATLTMNVAAGLQPVEGLPDLQELLSHQDKDGGLSEKDVMRVQNAFKRFQIPGSSDLHKGDLPGLLRYLGHVITDEELLEPLIKEVSTYEDLDFDEVVSFMERYIPFEKEQIKIIFHKFDEDASGSIDVTELKVLLQALGFIPLRSMIAEALRIVDANGNGDLDYDEFVLFLAIYRRAEGFTTEEVVELRRIFDFFKAQAAANNPPPSRNERHGRGGTSDLLPAELLSDALVQMFGLHVSEFTEKLETQLRGGTGLQASSYAVGGSKKAEGLRFTEFLIFARKTREEVLQHLKSSFHAEGHNDFASGDENGDGKISEDELRRVLKKKNYTPLQQNIDEIFNELHKGDSRDLDFNEFFDFMLIFSQREGFRKAVVTDMRSVFDRFDTEQCGEISALQLADLFREFGHKDTLDEIHIFVAQVDDNDSGSLDFREFMRLMRLHREKELKSVLREFERSKVQETGKFPKDATQVALVALGYDEIPKDLEIPSDANGQLSFDELVGVVDACRLDRVEKERKKAGFTDEKVTELRHLFDTHDKDKGGEIDTIELLGILKVFGWEPKSREEQSALVNKLETARQRAREAGVKDVGEEGAITFWAFVQLARMLEMEFAHAEEERMHKLMQDLKFSQKEVEQFREIFLAKKQEYIEESKQDLDVNTLKGVPRDIIRRLIKSLGVAIVGERKPMLDEELSDLGCPEDGLLDFFGFLQLMRWLMETGWMK